MAPSNTLQVPHILRRAQSAGSVRAQFAEPHASAESAKPSRTLRHAKSLGRFRESSRNRSFFNRFFGAGKTYAETRPVYRKDYSSDSGGEDDGLEKTLNKVTRLLTTLKQILQHEKGKQFDEAWKNTMNKIRERLMAALLSDPGRNGEVIEPIMQALDNLTGPPDFKSTETTFAQIGTLQKRIREVAPDQAVHKNPFRDSVGSGGTMGENPFADSARFSGHSDVHGWK